MRFCRPQGTFCEYILILIFPFLSIHSFQCDPKSVRVEFQQNRRWNFSLLMKKQITSTNPFGAGSETFFCACVRFLISLKRTFLARAIEPYLCHVAKRISSLIEAPGLYEKHFWRPCKFFIPIKKNARSTDFNFGPWNVKAVKPVPGCRVGALVPDYRKFLCRKLIKNMCFSHFFAFFLIRSRILEEKFWFYFDFFWIFNCADAFPVASCYGYDCTLWFIFFALQWLFMLSH